MHDRTLKVGLFVLKTKALVTEMRLQTPGLRLQEVPPAQHPSTEIRTQSSVRRLRFSNRRFPRRNRRKYSRFPQKNTPYYSRMERFLKLAVLLRKEQCELAIFLFLRIMVFCICTENHGA